MNDRIRELEKQATTVIEGWSDENGTTRHYEFNRKTFAELIVKECMALCLTSVGNGDYNRGRMDCHDNIREVFGIKK